MSPLISFHGSNKPNHQNFLSRWLSLRRKGHPWFFQPSQKFLRRNQLSTDSSFASDSNSLLILKWRNNRFYSGTASSQRHGSERQIVIWDTFNSIHGSHLRPNLQVEPLWGRGLKTTWGPSAMLRRKSTKGIQINSEGSLNFPSHSLCFPVVDHGLSSAGLKWLSCCV